MNVSDIVSRARIGLAARDTPRQPRQAPFSRLHWNVTLLAVLLLQAGCATRTHALPDENTQLTLLAANGGSWYRQVNLQLAEVLATATEGDLQIMSAAPSAPLTNLKGLEDRAGAVVFQSWEDAVISASDGSLRVRDEPVERIEGITALFPTPALSTYMVVSKLSGLSSLEDLQGMDVAWLTVENTPDRLIFEHYLNRAGLRPKALLLSERSLSDAVQAMREERIDGFIVKRLGPAEDLSNAVLSLQDIGTRILPLTDELIEAFRSQPIDIPANTFAGQPEKIVTGGWPMFAYANADVSETMAYQLTKAFWEGQDALITKAAGWKGVSPALLSSVKTSIHPGALRYYRETGIKVPGT